MIFSSVSIYDIDNADQSAVLPRKLPCMALFIMLSGCLSQAMAADEPGAIRTAFGDFFGSTTGQLRAYVDMFTEDAPAGVEDDKTSLFSELMLQNYVVFTDSLSFETELIVTVTAPNKQSGMFSTPGVINPEPPFVDFRTFMLTWQGEKTAVNLGKGVVELGLAEIFSPVDRFNSQNYSNPQHFTDRGEIQISITRFFESGELTFRMLPFYEDFIDPPGVSRWLNSQGDRDFFDQISAKEENRPHSFPEDWGYLLEFNGISYGFDYYVALHQGPGAYPIIQFSGIVIPPKTEKIYPTATSAMAGLVATSGSWSYYIDINYQHTNRQEDDSFARWALGFSYQETRLANKLGLIQIKPILTYSGHKVLKDSDIRKTLYNSETARPHPESLLGRLEIRVTDKTLLTFLGSKNFQDKDSSFGFSFQYNYSDSLWFSTLGLFMDGNDDTQFGRWRDNDFVSIGFNYRF